MRWLLVGTTLVVAMVVASAAFAVGPWPGLAQSVTASSGDVRYTATRGHGVTTVRAVSVRNPEVVAAATFDGAYGIPAVTSDGLGGGLSPDGRLLVLGEPPTYNGLRAQSRFLVVSTAKLSLERTLVLDGEFGFDALSPDGRTLYLIQHTTSTDLVRYAVRAYDLRANRLLPQIIADKREPGEAMRGYPVARATSARGAWVYTLYQPVSGQPFVHALNAAGREAFCIDLPWQGSTQDMWSSRLELTKDGRRLVVRSPSGDTVATVDTKTLRASSSR